MFYSLMLERELELAPRFFGPRMREVLQQKLVSKVRVWEGGAAASKNWRARQASRACGGRLAHPCLFLGTLLQLWLGNRGGQR